MGSPTDTPISADQAWRIFNDWEATRREIGVIFYGESSGTAVYTLGFVESAQNELLLLKSKRLRASFNLALATFTYGPVPTWPTWPWPPIVEVTALRARLKNGDYLVLAERLRPESLPARLLPE